MNDEAMQSALKLARELDAKAIGTGMPHVYYEAQTLARALLAPRAEAVAALPAISEEDHYWLEKLIADVESPEQRPYITGFSPMRLDFMARMLRRALPR